MGLLPNYPSGESYEKDFPTIFQLFEFLEQGLSDGNLAGSAAIHIDKLNIEKHLVTIGTSETHVKHGLKAAPFFWFAMPESDIRIWQTRRGDSGHVYLAASSSGDATIVLGV